MIDIEQIEELKKQIDELTKSLSAKNAIISDNEKNIAKNQERISILEDQLMWLRKQIFGIKSEKRLPLNPVDLMPSLFDALLTDEQERALQVEAQRLNSEIEEAIAVEKHIRKKRDKNRTLDASKLEIVEKVIIPEGVDLDEYVVIDKEVTDKLIYVPSRIYIERTIRPRYVLKSHMQITDVDKRVFIIAPLPSSITPKSIVSSSLLTEIIIQKFLYHLPFYRTISKFKELGLVVSESTIGDWFSNISQRLKPIYDSLKEQVLSSDYIQADESTLRVIDNAKRGTNNRYIWVVRDAINGGVFFHYDNGSRSKISAQGLLESYRGALQVDGYSVYDQFESSPGVVVLGCMAHARRKFVDALSNNKQLASEGIVLFGKLYAIEKQAKEEGLNAIEIEALRREKAYPILQLFEKWLIDNSTKVLPSSPIGKAINYSYTLLPRLSRYVINGKYNIDNNLAESVIRPLAVGRKNWLHAGSTASATRTAMMYSFICSCKAVNVEPHLWFRYVIDNIGLYEQGKIEINELLPCNFDKRKSI